MQANVNTQRFKNIVGSHKCYLRLYATTFQLLPSKSNGSTEREKKKRLILLVHASTHFVKYKLMRDNAWVKHTSEKVQNCKTMHY